MTKQFMTQKKMCTQEFLQWLTRKPGIRTTGKQGSIQCREMPLCVDKY